MPPATKKKHRKKATKTKPQQDPTRCAFDPACPHPPVQDGLCIGHVVTGAIAKRGQRAARRGDVLMSLLATGANAALNQAIIDPRVAQHVRQRVVRPTRSTPPPPAPTADPFVVLGLDRATATAEDVKEMRKRLAAIYHTDTAGSGIAGSKMAEINEAADACLKTLG